MNAHDKFLQGMNAAVTGPGVPNTVRELPEEMRDVLRRTANQSVMVAWINADLLNRASLDVKKSVIFYDDAGIFEYALAKLPDAEMLRKLYVHTNVRYWTKGL
jgi:hypothetical protein